MNKIILSSIIIFFACSSIFGQSNDEKYAKDVKSIDAIINAYYDVVSGSSSEPWEFEFPDYETAKVHADEWIEIWQEYLDEQT